ncbi:MAG: N-acetylmuramoyl-L-alanine amidase [Elusimicrobiota bacterium]
MQQVLLLVLFSAAAVSAEAPQAPAAAPSASTAAPWVQVVWPFEGDDYPYLERSFTLGSVTPGSTLTVNGTALPVEDNGAFLGMLPFATGVFTLNYTAIWNGQFATSSVTVKVAPPGGLTAVEGKAVFLQPSEPLAVRRGDLIEVRCLGPAGHSGAFRIKGLTRWLPMAETAEPVPGVYAGHYWVQPRDRGEDREIECRIKSGMWGGVSARGPGRVTVLDPAQTRTAATKTANTVVKTIPGGYTLFYPPGVLFAVDGRRGELSRVRFTENFSGWVDTGRLEFLPEGTPPPRGMVGRWVRTYVEGDRVRLNIRAPVKLPYEVRHTIDPLRFEIRFFGAAQRFDRIVYRSDDPIVKEIRWRQESESVVLVSVETRLKWSWGYHGAYDEDGFFALEIRRPPDLTRSANVLAGRKIVIDPGHGPMKQAIGPLGTNERDLNMAVSGRLEALLLEAGADVYMIRTSSDGPSLVDRPLLAREAGGDIYISIHHNGFRKTWDPRSAPRGFTNFYYHSQSLPLVEAMHESYRQRHPDFADESVRWGDLHVLRITDMPSVLTESGYIVLPEHEKLFVQPAYQEKFARTMFEGMRNLYLEYQALQRKSPDEQAAAGALD